jgi:hypothetical protein
MELVPIIWNPREWVAPPATLKPPARDFNPLRTPAAVTCRSRSKVQRIPYQLQDLTSPHLRLDLPDTHGPLDCWIQSCSAQLQLVPPPSQSMHEVGSYGH